MATLHVGGGGDRREVHPTDLPQQICDARSGTEDQWRIPFSHPGRAGWFTRVPGPPGPPVLNYGWHVRMTLYFSADPKANSIPTPIEAAGDR